MFYKYLIILSAIVFSYSANAEIKGECSNYALSGAIKAYKSMAGTVQGSEGIEYKIKEKLKAKLPFHNYIISITDNNEDGDVWTLDYFVMTKKENGQCKVLKVREEPQTTKTSAVSDANGFLKITTYYDFNDHDLDEPITLDITADFVNDSDNYIDFRIFVDEDTYPAICYSGSKDAATDIINAILNITTGDSFILTSKISYQGDVIVHEGTYTEGSGDYDSDLNFEIKKCGLAKSIN